MARHPLHNLKNPTGYETCGECLHPGQRVGDAMVFPAMSYVPELRTHEMWIQHASEAVKNKQQIIQDMANKECTIQEINAKLMSANPHVCLFCSQVIFTLTIITFSLIQLLAQMFGACCLMYDRMNFFHWILCTKYMRI
jgi:hypothetical protein